MKTSLLLLLCFVPSFFIVGCRKPASEVITTVTVRANGVQYTGSGSKPLSEISSIISTLGRDTYYFHTMSVSPNNFELTLNLRIPSKPVVGTYTYTRSSDTLAPQPPFYFRTDTFKAGATDASIFKAGDSIVFTITAIHDRLADGTFAAKMSGCCGAATDRVELIGEFKNVAY